VKPKRKLEKKNFKFGEDSIKFAFWPSVEKRPKHIFFPETHFFQRLEVDLEHPENENFKMR
jgi:hypothetical protein